MQYGEIPEGPNNIRSLILEKEKELHDINEYRIRTLEGLLREKEQVMQSYKQKFYKLQEDFKYNLKLLEGRDEELAMYDSNFATLKLVVRDRDSEISELKIQLADAQSDLKAEKQKSCEGDLFMQQKLKEVRGTMESTRWSYDEDIRKSKEETEALKRRYERELREKEEDVESMRRELTITFDEVLRQREQEFRQIHDEITGKHRDLELKVKSSIRENETLKERNNELKKKLDELTEQLNESEKSQKALQWEIADVRALKEAKISELEQETAELQRVKQALLDEYEGKMADLLQSLHAVEKAFLAQKNQYEEELKRAARSKDDEVKQQATKMESRIEAVVGKLRIAEETLEKVQNEFKQAKWEAEDQLLQREREFERIVGDHKDTLDQRDGVIKELKNQLWTREVELISSKDAAISSIQLIESSKDKEMNLRRELQVANESIDELKRQVHTTTLSLESKLQEAEQEWMARHEVRTREMSTAKDRLNAEKQAAEEKLKHAESELLRIRGELYAQKAAIKANEAFSLPSIPPEVSPIWSDSSIPAAVSLPTPPQSINKNNEIMAENAKLKGMIRTMTEELMKQTAAPTPSTPAGAYDPEMQKQVVDLEINCRQLETKNSILEQQLASVRSELQASNAAVQEKTAAVDELRRQLSSPSTDPTTTCELQQQYHEAQAQIEILKKERDSLMELSNQLTAENRKLQLGASPGSDASLTLKQQELRIADLTQSLDEYRMHNKVLKKELRRWLKRDDADSSRASSVVDSNDDMKVRAFSLDAAKEEIQAARRRSTPSFVDTAKDPPPPALSDARLKLKHAKEVLALAGKKLDVEPPGGRPRAPSVVQRETESQRNVMSKLKELQSKRAEMAEERKKVRNYNISSTG